MMFTLKFDFSRFDFFRFYSFLFFKAYLIFNVIFTNF